MLTISSIAVSPAPPQAPAVARVQPAAAVKVSDAVSPDNQGVQVTATPMAEGAKAQLVYRPSALPPVTPTDEPARVDNFNNSATPERVGDVALRTPWSASSGGAAPAADAAATGISVAAQPTAAEEASAITDPNVTRPAAESDQSAVREPFSGPQGAPRVEGQLPEPVLNPAMQAMDTQIKELLPNMWKASRAAVDVLIGEEARAAAAARTEWFDGRTMTNDKPSELADTYSRTSTLPEPPTTGRSVDRLV